jgi:hypothetical protein
MLPAFFIEIIIVELALGLNKDELAVQAIDQTRPLA